MSGRPTKRHPFILPLDHIPEDGLEVLADAATDPEFQALLAEVSEGVEPTGRARLFIRRWPQRVDVEGEISAVVGQPCSRGLTPYAQPVQAEVRQILFLAGADVPESEQELGPEDLDRSEMVGDSLRLLEILREELHLALPMRPLCTTPCVGPCPAWGRDIPLDEPEPEEGGPDPRWAALADLKVKK